MDDSHASARPVRRLELAVFAMACLGTCIVSATAQQRPPEFNPAQTKLVITAKSGQANVRENVVFKSADGVELAMDLYRPATAGSAPAVVLVSGAGNVRGWGVYKDYGRLIAGSGLVAVIPDKRFAPQQSLEIGAEDTLDLLAHIRRNAASYGIDARRICLWTFSAGGALAYLGIPPENGFACVVSYYGLGSAVPRQVLQQHAGAMAPLFIVRAGRDSAQLNNVIDLFASMALALNAPVTLVNYAAGLHAFEVNDARPEKKEPSNVAEAERILRLTIDWIRGRVAGFER